jgi:hypothetical protein
MEHFDILQEMILGNFINNEDNRKKEIKQNKLPSAAAAEWNQLFQTISFRGRLWGGPSPFVCYQCSSVYCTIILPSLFSLFRSISQPVLYRNRFGLFQPQLGLSFKCFKSAIVIGTTISCISATTP